MRVWAGVRAAADSISARVYARKRSPSLDSHWPRRPVPGPLGSRRSTQRTVTLTYWVRSAFARPSPSLGSPCSGIRSHSLGRSGVASSRSALFSLV